jgi:predicted TPR repeat methyltransferase
VYWYIARQEEAVALCRAAIEIAPEYAVAHHTLGTALERMGRYDEAADSYRKALWLNPDEANWEFDLAAMTGEKTPAAPPADFVARLFDEYAPRFEEHLVGALKYQAPAHLLALVEMHLPSKDRGACALDVMDLGCGSGLCGRAFRPLARTLSGVDLSPQMVEIAQQTGMYDRVAVGDVTEGLRACRASSLDLIVAGDVLIYVGALEALFAAAAAALRPGGRLAFTVEAQDEPGYALRRTHRYTHSLAYVESTASATGLAKVDAQHVTLRINERQPVLGWAVLLGKP